MNERQVVRLALEFKQPPYVPWQMGFTREAAQKLKTHFATDDLDTLLGNHVVGLGSGTGFFEDLGQRQFRDIFGVVWDRSIDGDIGQPANQVVPEPALDRLKLPDPRDPRVFNVIPTRLARFGHRYRMFFLGFSLFERAWSMRGMETLLMDFYDHPQFVHDFFNALVDYNLAHVRKAMEYELDGVYFGDDWGQQHGLIMGYDNWKKFIQPALARMYSAVRGAGKHVWIHSCGDVDELFDELIAMGVNCFNPFQPEVMDVPDLMRRYHGRLAFWGGLSTQRTLPYGSVPDVRREAANLLEMGAQGGYVFAPAHAVEGDVPLENMLAFIEVAQRQRAAAMA